MDRLLYVGARGFPRPGLRTVVVGLLAAILLGSALLVMAGASRTRTQEVLPSGATPAPTAAPPTGHLHRSEPVVLSDEQVLIGSYVQNVQTIDAATNSFQADVYVWYRWTNPDLKPYKSVEIMNWHEAWQMMELGHQKKPRKQSDGSYYFVQRYAGAFNCPLSLVKFPFGTQYLSITLEDFEREKDRMQFVADDHSTSINPTITMPGYDFGEPEMTVADFAYDTDFGDLDGTSDEVYSRAVLYIPVSNPGLPNVIKYLVPIVLVVLAASLVFYLPPNEVEGRIALGITALLTLVAMEWSATESLPTVAYLTMLGVLYIVGTLFILASLVLGIRTTWMAREKNEQAAITSDERMLFVFLGTFAVVFCAVLVAYLTG